MAEIDASAVKFYPGVAWAVAYRSEDNAIKRFSPYFTTQEEIEWARDYIQALDPTADLSILEHRGNLH